MYKLKSGKVWLIPAFVYELSNPTVAALQELGYTEALADGMTLPKWRWLSADERLTTEARQEIAHYNSKTMWLMNCCIHQEDEGPDFDAGCPYCDEYGFSLNHRHELDRQTYGPYTRETPEKKKDVFIPAHMDPEMGEKE